MTTSLSPCPAGRTARPVCSPCWKPMLRPNASSSGITRWMGQGGPSWTGPPQARMSRLWRGTSACRSIGPGVKAASSARCCGAAPTAPVVFETPDGVIRAGGQGPEGTRLRFPQVSASLSVRWCSASLKVEVADRALRGQDRLLSRRTLMVTGERAEESPARAHYAAFEPHRTDTRDGTRRRRHVDHFRPVHAWSEAEVWAILSAGA